MRARPSFVVALSLTLFFFGCDPEAGDQASSPPPPSEAPEPAFEFTEVASGVFVAVPTETIPAICNAVVIVNESDVVIVDSHVIPEAASALMDEIRTITDKPVRFLVNTHFHIDHTFGNQAYPPDVETIGHEFTREMIEAGGSVSGRGYDLVFGPVPNRLASLRAQLDTASDAGSRAELERRVTYQEKFLAGVNSVVLTPPTRTFSDRMTLFRGDREIRLLFLGRGHTGGDVVVHLPKERVVITGDLVFEDGPAYMGAAYFTEWIDTLERLEELDFDWVIGGHAAPFRDREAIDRFQAYIRDYWVRAQVLFEEGLSVEAAAARMDMRDHSEHYPGRSEVGVRRDGVARAFELLGNAHGE